jgi:hypothetical protein
MPRPSRACTLHTFRVYFINSRFNFCALSQSMHNVLGVKRVALRDVFILPFNFNPDLRGFGNPAGLVKRKMDSDYNTNITPSA